jgi:shikimate dehydrogenase
MAPDFDKPIRATTRLVAVYGHPVRHSASPPMQNAGMAALGLDWRYVACDVPPTRLREAIEGAKAMHFVGLNLTVPHKLLAMEFVDEVAPSAREWGAVNTVVFEARDAEGQWRPLGQLDKPEGPVRSVGHNTDADAIVRSLRDDLAIEPRGARILLLGAGGAARAAALRLADEGVAGLWIVNRTQAKAEELAGEINERFPAVHAEAGYPDESIEILLNATSAGLRPDDPLPLDLGMYPINRVDGVYDMVYRPAVTPLLAAARAAGCRVANGLGMLLHQGADALELWSGKAAPRDVMRAALEHEVHG